MLNQIGAADSNARAAAKQRDHYIAERDRLIVAAIADGVTVDQVLRVVYSLTAADIVRITDGRSWVTGPTGIDCRCGHDEDAHPYVEVGDDDVPASDHHYRTACVVCGCARFTTTEGTPNGC